MSRKSTILALAAIASLSTFALSSTSASAFGGGRGMGGGHSIGGGGHHGGGMHLGGGMHRMHGGGISFRRVVHFRPHWRHPHFRIGWRRPYWVAPVIATGLATTYATAPTWNRCTCLTKEYTPEGAVVFKDLCTKEMAMNPPEVSAPAAEYTPAPQPPQTQGYAQPQPYPQYR